MTTNKPTTYWAPSTALHRLESRHNNAPCILTDGPAEFNDVALVRLADYEALQAAHEEELFQVRQDRDAHFGELMRALEQVDALQAECEKLRAALRRLCNIYVVDDYYSGDLREEMLGQAVERAIDAAIMKEASHGTEVSILGGGNAGS